MQRIKVRVLNKMCVAISEKSLIECVQAHECLYNNKSKNYKDLIMKQAAWEKIAIELNTSASECKKYWNQLRNAFLHAISRRKTATGQRLKFFKKWKYEEEMSFLLPFMGLKQTFFNAKDDEQTNSSNAFEKEGYKKDDVTKQNNNKRKQNSHKKIIKIINLKKQSTQERDEIDLFFESLAQTVKRLPKLEQVQLKLDVMELVNEIENRCLENNTLLVISDTPSRTLSNMSPSPSFILPDQTSPKSFDEDSEDESLLKLRMKTNNTTVTTHQTLSSTLTHTSSFNDVPMITDSHSPLQVTSNGTEFSNSCHDIKPVDFPDNYEQKHSLLNRDVSTMSSSTSSLLTSYVNLPNSLFIEQSCIKSEEDFNEDIKPTLL